MTRLLLAGLIAGLSLASPAASQGEATKIDLTKLRKLEPAQVAELKAKLAAGQAESAKGQDAKGKKKAKTIKATAMRLMGAGVKRKPPTQKELTKRYEDKMGEAWIQNASWVTDFDKARSAAKESGKLIFAYFTRSYAP